jgi:phospholipid transport system substrate-binding protein
MTATKRRLSLLAGLALCAGLTSPTRPALALTAGAATVQSFYSTLLETMRGGAVLGAKGRYARLTPVVQESFDIPFMTRLAVGPEWNNLTSTQRSQVTEAFERYVAAIYAERFNTYSGQQLKVTGETSSAAGTIITSQIIKSNGEPVNVNYLMRDNKIADVYLNGTISEVATRRSEFSAILRSQGIDGLITALNIKVAALTS